MNTISPDNTSETTANEKSTQVDSAAQFVNIVSHDLSAPIRHARYFSEQLLESLEGSLDESQTELAGHITGSLNRMQEMLTGLLQYSRLISQFNPRAEFPVQALFHDVRRQIQPMLEAAGIDLYFPETDIQIAGDRKQLTLMLKNLIDNAVKFTSSNETADIEIGLQQEERNTVFTISDNGIGVEESQHEFITQVFRQLDPNVTGLGMGLALVERIITNHEGKIQFAEVEPHGLKVRITLPTQIEGSEV